MVNLIKITLIILSFIILPFYTILITASDYNFQDKVIIDSNISLAQAISGKEIPASVSKNLVLVDVLYYSFDGILHKGQIVVHKDLKKDVKAIFELIEKTRYPVNKVVPISFYKWCDSLSIADNNTSGFNYRLVEGTKVMSKHATGRAIDLNPYLNPMIKPGNSDKSVRPYDPSKPGTLTINSPVVKFFLQKGWQWGGRWRSVKDFQHFEK